MSDADRIAILEDDVTALKKELKELAKKLASLTKVVDHIPKPGSFVG